MQWLHRCHSVLHMLTTKSLALVPPAAGTCPATSAPCHTKHHPSTGPAQVGRGLEQRHPMVNVPIMTQILCSNGSCARSFWWSSRLQPGGQLTSSKAVRLITYSAAGCWRHSSSKASSAGPKL
jgi:hypothetical protein